MSDLHPAGVHVAWALSGSTNIVNLVFVIVLLWLYQPVRHYQGHIVTLALLHVTS